MSKRPNKIVTFNIHGGLIGLFIGDESTVLKKTLARENDSGWRYKSHTSTAINMAALFIRLFILAATLFLWTWGTKHILVLDRMEDE